MNMIGKKLIAALLICAMMMTPLAGLAETAAPEAAAAETAAAGADAQEAAAAAVEGEPVYHRTEDGFVFFVEGDMTGKPISGMAEAEAFLKEAQKTLGDDPRVHFEPWRELTDSKGNHTYIFQQMYDETTVSGGAVKIVTDGEGKMLGLIRSIEQDLPDTQEGEGIDAAEAEKKTQEFWGKSHNGEKLEILAGKTIRVILPVVLEIDPYTDEKEESHYVWAVYSNNPAAGKDRGSEMPYLAHYVTMKGEYLYSLPTVMPQDEASTAGFGSAYVFENMEPAPYTGKVRYSDGTEKEITIDLMRDSKTGVYYLGNLERRIVVADCYPFIYENGSLALETSQDNKDWNNTSLMSLYHYCMAYDFYREIGWLGGDGLGTPILILKDFCDKNHEPIDNAAYAGKYHGWQLFLSSGANDLAQCLDVLGHEYTHCFTHSIMTYNAYMNDFGAINEAMSDIMGNICEMMAGDTTDTEWSLGENGKGGAVRSMSEPHKHNQPAYTWDLYYQANVKTPTPFNDQGGVHTNSSLLNHVAWSLCAEGGMPLEEARLFWFAVDCAMVPGTDYPQLAVLLPWVMKIQGLEKYQGALAKVIDKTKLGQNGLPETLPGDRALVTLTLPETDLYQDGNWSLFIFTVNVDEIMSRVLQMIMGEGEYGSALVELEKILGINPVSETAPGTEGGGLLDALLGRLTKNGKQKTETAGDPTKTEEAGDQTKAEEKPSGFTLPPELKDWIRRNLKETFFLGHNSAGQDGRTIRMVCQPGYTIPLLVRLEMSDDGNEMKSAAVAAYLMNRWVDLGGPIKKAMEIAGDEQAVQAWVDSINFDEVFAAVMDWKNQLVFRIPQGGTVEIPGTGLENVTILDKEFLDVMMSKEENAEAKPEEKPAENEEAKPEEKPAETMEAKPSETPAETTEAKP